MTPSILKRLAEYLRISAVVRLFRSVQVRRSELAGLIGFSLVFTAFESVGISLLLPILQFAENRGKSTAITDSGGGYFGVVNQLLSKVGIDTNSLAVLIIIAFIPILLRQFVYYYRAWYTAETGGNIAMRMRERAVKTMFSADPEFFNRYSAGHLSGVIVNQAATAGSSVTTVINQISLAMLVAAYTGILIIISLPLTMVSVATFAVVFVLGRITMRRIGAFSRQAANESQSMLAQVVERYSLMHLVKLRHQESKESENVLQFTERIRQLGVDAAKESAKLEVQVDPLMMASVFLTLYIGITFIGSTLAQLGLLMFVLTRLNAKVKEFNQGLANISKEVQSLHLMNDMLDDASRSNTIASGTVPFTGLEQGIEYRNVVFAYPDKVNVRTHETQYGEPVLKDINFTIGAGTLVALVGRSGAGKSTAVELIPRMRDVTGGQLLFDGTDVRDFELGSLRRGVGYLTQHALILNESVRSNLEYGLGFEPTDEQIRAAIEGAHATFLYDLPGGLDTIVGPRGSRLSGGQAQRLAMARVFLEDTDILVFDEPTSALDSESEGYIQDAIHSLHGKKTIIVVAHRLATVIQADQLLVVQDGEIVERGTHAELVEAGGSYQRLFHSQLLT